MTYIAGARVSRDIKNRIVPVRVLPCPGDARTFDGCSIGLCLVDDDVLQGHACS